jgi:hypothetical protein
MTAGTMLLFRTGPSIAHHPIECMILAIPQCHALTPPSEAPQNEGRFSLTIGAKRKHMHREKYFSLQIGIDRK